MSEIDIPYLSIQNQIMRATRLNAVLKKRKNWENDVFSLFLWYNYNVSMGIPKKVKGDFMSIFDT